MTTINKNEIWKPIKGLENTKYLISNFGNIKNTETNYILEKNNKTGYSTVLITHKNKSKTYKVHLFVAKTFIKNDNPKNVVNHIDGNKLNNRVSNLEWISQSENVKHAIENSLYVPNKSKIIKNKDLNEFNSIKSKIIKDFPKYSITEDGRIFSHFNGIFLAFKKNEEGYIRITLRNGSFEKKMLLHRIVAEAFIPNPENKPQVNHIDSNKENNCVSNLEWITNKENRLHALKNYKVLNIVTFPIDSRQTQKNIIKAKVEINFLKKTLNEDLEKVIKILNCICKI